MALGSASWLRVDYPATKSDAEGQARSGEMRVNLLAHVGFSLIPISYERLLQFKILLEPKTNPTEMKVVFSGLEQTSATETEEKEYFSRSFPLPDTTAAENAAIEGAANAKAKGETLPREYCYDMGPKTSTQTIPLAAFCIRSVTEPTGSPESVRDRLEASVCIPALTNTCFTVPLAKITRKADMFQLSKASRRLADTHVGVGIGYGQ